MRLMHGFRWRGDVAISAALLVMASSACAFAPVAPFVAPRSLRSTVLLRERDLEGGRRGLSDTVPAQNASASFRSPLTLVQESLESEAVRKSALEHAVGSALDKFDRYAGSALDNMHSLASSLPSGAHAHLHLPGVAFHAIAAALPAVAIQQNFELQDMLVGFIPFAALLAAAGALLPHASTTHSIVLFLRGFRGADEAPGSKAGLSRGEREDEARASGEAADE